MLKIENEQLKNLIKKHYWVLISLILLGLSAYFTFLFYENFFVPIYLKPELAKSIAQDARTIDAKKISETNEQLKTKTEYVSASSRNLFSF